MSDFRIRKTSQTISQFLLKKEVIQREKTELQEPLDRYKN